jgi:hypothetical protein
MLNDNYCRKRVFYKPFTAVPSDSNVFDDSNNWAVIVVSCFMWCLESRLLGKKDATTAKRLTKCVVLGFEPQWILSFNGMNCNFCDCLTIAD